MIVVGQVRGAIASRRWSEGRGGMQRKGGLRPRRRVAPRPSAAVLSADRDEGSRVAVRLASTGLNGRHNRTLVTQNQCRATLLNARLPATAATPAGTHNAPAIAS